MNFILTYTLAVSHLAHNTKPYFAFSNMAYRSTPRYWGVICRQCWYTLSTMIRDNDNKMIKLEFRSFVSMKTKNQKLKKKKQKIYHVYDIMSCSIKIEGMEHSKCRVLHSRRVERIVSVCLFRSGARFVCLLAVRYDLIIINCAYIIRPTEYVPTKIIPNKWSNTSTNALQKVKIFGCGS